MAGIAAGIRYGVAKNASIFAVKVLGCTGGGTMWTLLVGLDVVVANRRPSRGTVINLSLSGFQNSEVDATINELVTQHGIAVAAAAGNSGGNACRYSPSAAKEALTVAATTSSDALASYSNFGKCVDMAAPGQGVEWGGGRGEPARAPLWGKSMAAPHAAGTLVLIWSTHGDKTDARGVIATLKARATPGVVSGKRPPSLLYTRLVDVEPLPPGKRPGRRPRPNNGN